MKDRTCAQCGTSLAGRSSRARFCGSSCRAKSHKAGTRNAEVVQLRTREQRKAAEAPARKAPARKPKKPEVEVPIERVGIRVSILDTYSEAELTSPVGCIAVKLARDVDHMLPGTPGYASVVKELRGALDDLDKRSASQKVNPLVELRRRRLADRVSG